MNRIATLFSLSLLTLIITACGGYKQVSLSNHEFYNNDKVPSKIDKYNVYVHEGTNLYRLSDRKFENDTLRGVLEPIPAGSVNAHPEQQRQMRESRKDMHVYLSKGSNELLVARDTSTLVKRVVIDRSAVDRVDMFAQNEEHVFRMAGIFIALLVIGGLILAAIVYALAAASSEAANGSGSDSNSDSGDSNSGDSGGSDSDSGCYIATMVYGSYDAPKVMVLRAFRDRFLQRYGWGRRFISWYYRASPQFVARHRDKSTLNSFIRACLNVVVWCLRPFYGR